MKPVNIRTFLDHNGISLTDAAIKMGITRQNLYENIDSEKKTKGFIAKFQQAFDVRFIDGNLVAIQEVDTNAAERLRIATAALQGLCGNPEFYKIAYERTPHDQMASLYAIVAVEQADALIAELNKSKS